MFGNFKSLLSLVLMFLIGSTLTACSEGGFGGGSFSGASKKVANDDDGTECVLIEDNNDDNDLKAENEDKVANLVEDCPEGYERVPIGGGDDSNDDDDDDDDDDIDWDDTDSAKLRETMKISQVGDGDDKSRLVLSFVTSNGSGPEQSVSFKEKEKSTKDVPQICRKKGKTKIKVVLHGRNSEFVWQAKQMENAKWTRVGDSIKVHIDMDGCGGLGKCLDAGKDNAYIFECPNSKVVIDGLSL